MSILRRPTKRLGSVVVRECGAATAEVAVLLPALIVILALALWSVSAVSAQLRCVDAAREAARALARGDSLGSARAAAIEIAPPEATVAMSFEGENVRVVVTARASRPGGLPMPSLAVDATAVARVEPGVVVAGGGVSEASGSAA